MPVQENTKVYVVVPGVEERAPLYIGSPRLARPDQAADFEKEVLAIPEREAWLYRNPEAMAAVRRGLEQARNGEFSGNPPDLGADAALVDEADD